MTWPTIKVANALGIIHAAQNQQGPTAALPLDTPLKQAIRRAFDTPTIANIEAVAGLAEAEVVRLTEANAVTLDMLGDALNESATQSWPRVAELATALDKVTKERDNALYARERDVSECRLALQIRQNMQDAAEALLGAKQVTRLEVIDDGVGRALTRRPCSIELSFQDDSRTLKVFVRKQGA